jgi:hypothetical protein
MAAGEHEAPEHHREYNHHANNLEHRPAPEVRLVFSLRRLCTSKLNGLFRGLKKNGEGKGNSPPDARRRLVE